MSLSGDRLARAERQADAARNRLRATADRLRARLAPSQLLEDALDEGRRLTETGAARAREHPVAVAGLGALFSAVAWFIRRRRKRRRATDAPSESLPTERAEPRRPRRSR